MTLNANVINTNQFLTSKYPRYQFSLKSETINNLPILETVALSKWHWMQFSLIPINSSFQNNPRYQFPLKSENIEILPILSAAVLKMTAIRSRFFFVRIFYQPYLNIYAKSCGNPFGSFRYKWGQRFWYIFTVSLVTAAILKIPRPDGTSWDGDPPFCEV